MQATIFGHHANILTPRGHGRGRYYIAGEPLTQIHERRRAKRAPLRDPYPWMRAELGQPTTGLEERTP